MNVSATFLILDNTGSNYGSRITVTDCQTSNFMQELKDKICSVYRITVEQILTLTEVEVSTPEQDLQQQAYTWFRSLSINQMKEVCNKHHAPYYVSCIMGSHAKYASVGLQRKLITEVWEGEGKPEPQKVN